MALKMSPTLRSNRANQIEVLIAGGTLEIRSGAQPTNTASADAGTLLCTITLPTDCLTAGSGGVVSKNGVWSGLGTLAAGIGTNAGHFRFKTSGGAVVMDGSMTSTGGGGDMTIDNLSIAQNQTVTVNTFTYTDGNA
jgi:hypothetical protein